MQKCTKKSHLKKTSEKHELQSRRAWWKSGRNGRDPSFQKASAFVQCDYCISNGLCQNMLYIMANMHWEFLPHHSVRICYNEMKVYADKFSRLLHGQTTILLNYFQFLNSGELFMANVIYSVFVQYLYLCRGLCVTVGKVYMQLTPHSACNLEMCGTN